MHKIHARFVEFMQKSAIADQQCLAESEKDDLLNQLEEESSRQDKVHGCSVNKNNVRIQNFLRMKTILTEHLAIPSAAYV